MMTPTTLKLGEQTPMKEQRIQFSGAGFTKPAGTEVIAISVNVKSEAPTSQEPFTVTIKKGSTWYSMPNQTQQFGSSSDGTKRREIVFTRAMGWGDWSQAELNGLQVGILTGDLTGKNDKVTIHYMYVTAYCGQWGNQCRDYVGGNHLVNRNAVGQPERLLSYL